MIWTKYTSDQFSVALRRAAEADQSMIKCGLRQ